jgi:hypothetical protein
MSFVLAIDWDKLVRVLVHAALMFGSIWIGTHPELSQYAPVLQYIGNSINSK